MSDESHTGELPDALERQAADLWRKENPTTSVFAIDAETKARYRRRVVRGTPVSLMVEAVSAAVAHVGDYLWEELNDEERESYRAMARASLSQVAVELEREVERQMGDVVHKRWLSGILQKWTS